MSKVLNSNTKFKLCQFNHDKELNYILNLEKKITNVLEDLKNKEKIAEVGYNHLYHWGSRRDILYGLTEVPKPRTERCASLRHIFSAINTPSYKLAKLLFPLLTPLRTP